MDPVGDNSRRLTNGQKPGEGLSAERQQLISAVLVARQLQIVQGQLNEVNTRLNNLDAVLERRR